MAKPSKDIVGSKTLREFKDFINRGNVVDLAVAVIIGAAFTAIVNSVVSDLIMPVISLVTGGIDFADMKIPLGDGPNAAAIAYGNFINAVIQFLIIAAVVFAIVKALGAARLVAKRGDTAEKATAPKCPYCLEDVVEGATRCPHCTAELPKPASASQPSGDERANS